MSTTDTDLTKCANCGKGEEAAGDLKACTACKMVKYCKIENAKLIIVRSIKKSVRNVRLYCMILNSSSSRRSKIV